MPAAVIPGGLAAMPPGPALAATLGAIELHRVPNDRMPDVLQARYRQLGHQQARMAATLVEIGRCEAIAAPGAVARLPRPCRYTAEETRAALHWTRNAADSEHEFAENVVHTMPQVFTAWWAGRPRPCAAPPPGVSSSTSRSTTPGADGPPDGRPPARQRGHRHGNGGTGKDHPRNRGSRR